MQEKPGFIDRFTQIDELLAENVAALKALMALISRPAVAAGPILTESQITAQLISGTTFDYNVQSFSMTTARTNEEVIVGGDFIHAWTDGDMDGIGVRLNSTIADIIYFRRRNPVLLRLHKFYLTHTAQTGKTLDILVVRTGQTGGAIPSITDVSPDIQLILDRQAVILDIAKAALVTTETGGTLTTNGTEQTLFIMESPMGIFEPIELNIDFTAHTAGETLVIRTYYRIKSGGNYIKQTEDTYAGAQDPDLITTDLVTNRFGIKVTVEKTGGTNRAYDWEAMYRG